jgi:hypothetical protein
LGLLVAAFTAGPAQAEVAFTPPQTLFSGAVGSPRMAVDSQGHATLVALDAAGDEGGTMVQVVRIGSIGLPEPIHTLEEVPYEPPIGRCICPRVAVDPSGRAIVTWQTVVEGERRAMAALIDPNGEPQAPKLLSPEGVDAANPRVTANGKGFFALAWQVDGAEGRIEAALVEPDGTFDEPHALNEPGDEGAYPYLASGPDGAFHLAWEQGGRIQATVLDEEGDAGAIQPVSPDGETAFLSGIVVDSNERTTIAWWRPNGAYEAKAVRLDASGAPGTIWTLNPSSQNVGSPSIAVDGQDRVTAVWEDFQSHVTAIRLGADGVPGEPHQISPEGHLAGTPQLAAAPDGRGVVAWSHPARFAIPEEACGVTKLEPEDDVVRAALLGSDGALDRVYDVSAHGEEAVGAEVAFDSLGLPWLAWETYDGTYFCEDVSGRILVSHGFEPQDAPGQGSTSPPTPQPRNAPPVLSLSKRGMADGGRVRIKVRCSGQSGGFCLGSLRLLTPAAALLPSAASPSTRRSAALTLAGGRYRVAEGSAATLKLSIPRTARRLIAARKPRRLVSVVRGHGLPAMKVLIRVIGSNP